MTEREKMRYWVENGKRTGPELERVKVYQVVYDLAVQVLEPAQNFQPKKDTTCRVKLHGHQDRLALTYGKHQ